MPIALICLAGMALLWHCKFSFCQSDEAFYLALAHRFWMGDRPLIDEMQIAQLYAPILLPAYAFFRQVVASGEGVYLFFRMLYVSFSILSSCLLYYSAKRHVAKSVALVGSILLLLYSRANINGPSYYNLCLHFATLAIVLHTIGSDCAKTKRARCWLYVMSGSSFALAVICNPAAFIIAIPFTFLVKRDGGVFHTLAGILLIFFGYLPFVFGRVPMGELLPAVQKVLNDPQHQQTLADKAKHAIDQWHRCTSPLVPYVTAIACLWVALRKIVDKGGRLETFLPVLYLWICLALVWHTARMARTSICFVITAPSSMLLLPFVVDAMAQKNRNASLGCYLYTFGLCLAAAFLVGSNTSLDAMTVGFSLATIGGLFAAQRCVLVSGGFKGARMEKPSLLPIAQALPMALLCLMMIAVFGAHRFLGIYRDAPLSDLIVPIEHGPAKGLVTTAEHAEEYEGIYRIVTETHDLHPDGGVLFSKRLPWGYLITDWQCATPTAWTVPMSDARLDVYYSERECWPKVIILLDADTTGWVTAPFNSHAGTNDFNKNSLEGPFYEWVENNMSESKHNEWATAYTTMDGPLNH